MAQMMECNTDHVPYFSEAAGYNDLLLMESLSLTTINKVYKSLLPIPCISLIERRRAKDSQ